MTRFRPCIDLHAGQVKQIVGGTLTDTITDLKTNFTSTQSAAYYATLYKQTKSLGAHVIMLGPGNESAAREALSAWPGNLQVGGGITDLNAREWIEAGAEKIIITSFLFPEGKFSLLRLQSVLKAIDNDKTKLVLDLSCRRKGETWFVAMNKWQTITEMEVTKGKFNVLRQLTYSQIQHRFDTITALQPFCSEFLIHAADNEGLQAGVDLDLIKRLSEWCDIPVTYAGGARTVNDLGLVREASKGKVDLTIGSALDIFGGSGANFVDCVAWNRTQDES